MPLASNAPPIDGPMADARLRGTAVKLAAAARSGGVTEAITNAERAGTSICDSALRASRQVSASGRLGTSAAATRNRLAGIWVNPLC